MFTLLRINIYANYTNPVLAHLAGFHRFRSCYRPNPKQTAALALAFAIFAKLFSIFFTLRLLSFARFDNYNPFDLIIDNKHGGKSYYVSRYIKLQIHKYSRSKSTVLSLSTRLETSLARNA